MHARLCTLQLTWRVGQAEARTTEDAKHADDAQPRTSRQPFLFERPPEKPVVQSEDWRPPPQARRIVYKRELSRLRKAAAKRVAQERRKWQAAQRVCMRAGCGLPLLLISRLTGHRRRGGCQMCWICARPHSGPIICPQLTPMLCWDDSWRGALTCVQRATTFVVRSML